VTLRFLLLLILFSAGKVWAYPAFISYRYQSCIGCHYNPMGNGPLTDYGRTVAATEITDRKFLPAKVRDDDEKLADMSGFFFGPYPNNWFRPSASYRGLYYQGDPGSPTQKSQWIHMDASVALVAKFLRNDKLTFVTQFSYAPTPLASQSSGKKYEKYRSRQLYMGYRATKTFGLYAGLMDKAFGIQVPDHNSFARKVTHNTMNDQTVGVLAHILTEKFEWAIQPFFGNPVQEANLRQKGATTQMGYMVGETTRIGASVAVSKSQFLALNMFSVDMRAGFGKGNSMLFEAGQVQSKPADSDATTARYVFVQNQWLLSQGLSALLTGEYQQPDTHVSAESYSFGPGIQYFPVDRVELRADIFDTRIRSSQAYADDKWTVTGQLHLWF
jgi:hypothetical protein